MAGEDRSAHESLLQLLEMAERCGRTIGDAFDDMRRSQAIQRLAALISLDVVTESELAGFAPETRKAAERLAGLRAGLSLLAPGADGPDV